MGDVHDELMKLPEQELLPADDHALDELNLQTNNLRSEFEPQETVRPKMPKKIYTPTTKGRAFDIMNPANRRSSLRSTLKTTVPEESAKLLSVSKPDQDLSHDVAELPPRSTANSSSPQSHHDEVNDYRNSVEDRSEESEIEEKHEDFVSTAAQLGSLTTAFDEQTNIFDTENYHVPLPAPLPSSHTQNIVLTILLVVLVSAGLLFTYLLLN